MWNSLQKFEVPNIIIIIDVIGSHDHRCWWSSKKYGLGAGADMMHGLTLLRLSDNFVKRGVSEDLWSRGQDVGRVEN